MATLKAIKDPESKVANLKAVELPSKMTIRKLLIKERKSDGKVAEKKTSLDPNIKWKGSPSDQVFGADGKVDCNRVAKLALEAIESADKNKTFTVGKTKKMWCGQVVVTIPVGGYGRIGGGECIIQQKPPLEKGGFKYDRDNQLAVSVSKGIGKDFVLVVAQSGCLFADSSSVLSFHTPVFIVEPTGDYYKVVGGKRIVHLGPGGHVLVYTKEAPILFVRMASKDKAVTKPKVVVESAPKDEKKTESKKGSELKKGSEEKTKSEEAKTKSEEAKTKSEEAKPKSEEPKTKSEEPKAKSVEQPKKIESKDEDKEKEKISSLFAPIESSGEAKMQSKEDDKNSLDAAPRRPWPSDSSPVDEKAVVAQKEPADEAVVNRAVENSGRWQKYIPLIVGLILVLLLILFLAGRSRKDDDQKSGNEGNQQ